MSKLLLKFRANLHITTTKITNSAKKCLNCQKIGTNSKQKLITGKKISTFCGHLFREDYFENLVFKPFLFISNEK